jgi:hypothetical protein
MGDAADRFHRERDGDGCGCDVSACCRSFHQRLFGESCRRLWPQSGIGTGSVRTFTRHTRPRCRRVVEGGSADPGGRWGSDRDGSGSSSARIALTGASRGDIG